MDVVGEDEGPNVMVGTWEAVGISEMVGEPEGGMEIVGSWDLVGVADGSIEAVGLTDAVGEELSVFGILLGEPVSSFPVGPTVADG
mmetsp:Transcript_16767/g.46079  ORF Transcript_16767/g.46079 Transcript_16767/m.46079 type:complete len:86 (+) Transcript_16767:109-366(+)